MSIYKSGSVKLEPFKPSLKTKQLRLDIKVDSLNRIQSIEAEFTGVKKAFVIKGSINKAFKEVETFFEKALKSQRTRQNR